MTVKLIAKPEFKGLAVLSKAAIDTTKLDVDGKIVNAKVEFSDIRPTYDMLIEYTALDDRMFKLPNQFHAWNNNSTFWFDLV